jgi:hypothetical protein
LIDQQQSAAPFSAVPGALNRNESATVLDLTSSRWRPVGVS